MGETKEIERSVQMRLYALHKRQFVAVFAVFFICLFIAILIGIAGPSIIQSTMAPIESPAQQLSGPYNILSKPLDKFHQRLWLTMKAKTNSNNEFRQLLNVTIFVNDTSLSSNLPSYKRQRTIHCQKQVSKKEEKENSF